MIRDATVRGDVTSSPTMRAASEDSPPDAWEGERVREGVGETYRVRQRLEDRVGLGSRLA